MDMCDTKMTTEKTTDRQYNLDILTAFAIIATLICHPVLIFSSYIPGHEDDFLFFLGEIIIGEYLFVAHAFI